MDKPYCIVEGKKYKLNSVYSFPEIMETPDLNQLWIDYSYNRITLHDVFLIYSSIGCSYDFVFNYFSKSGRYGSCRRKGDFLNFELFTDDDKMNNDYNDTKEEDIRTDVEDILTEIVEDYEFDKKDIIVKLEKCIQILKQ